MSILNLTEMSAESIPVKGVYDVDDNAREMISGIMKAPGERTNPVVVKTGQSAPEAIQGRAAMLACIAEDEGARTVYVGRSGTAALRRALHEEMSFRGIRVM